MNPIIPSQCATRRGRIELRLAKSLLLAPFIGSVLSLSSCDADKVIPTPELKITADTKPIGDGISLLAFGIVGAAVVVVLGRLLR